MKLIDVHTHLSSQEFDVDRKEILERALTVCDLLIDIGAGTSPDAFQKACSLAETHSQVYFTAGIHPHDATLLGSNKEILQAIEKVVNHAKCVAVGECGLDYYYKNSDPQDQKKIFEWHRDLAQQNSLPLMIHTRDAEEESQILLRDYQGPGVFHCFTGTKEMAQFAIQKGFFISFSGIVTFKNAQNLREVFLTTPLENVLVETDAPFLAPVPMRGKRNESSFIEHTAKFLARLRNISFEEFSEVTSRNALKLFQKISFSKSPADYTTKNH